jgi:predicted nucleic acid-binding protein
LKGIADTGFLLAFLDRNDSHHPWAVSVARSVDPPLLTCEAVLAETAYHRQSVSAVLEMIRLGMVQLAFDCSAHLANLTALAVRYSDRKPDLADLCLIRMSELYPKHVVLTIDEDDFRVYRRNKREVIPILSPGGRSLQ